MGAGERGEAVHGKPDQESHNRQTRVEEHLFSNMIK